MSRPNELVLQEGESIDLPKEAGPNARRFQKLLDAKYTCGLSAAESSELDRLEAGFRESDAEFYDPILERLKPAKSSAAKRRST